MFVGYARVSTRGQNQALQIDALHATGCDQTFMKKASGANHDRPDLKAVGDFIHAGDTLVVWKFDRLAQSVRQVAVTTEDLASAESAFWFSRWRSTRLPKRGGLFFMCSPLLPNLCAN